MALRRGAGRLMGRLRYGAGLRDRLRRLEEAAREETMTLVCPECGAEFVAHGDVPMEFVVHQWTRETGEAGRHETPDGILRIFDHGHAANADAGIVAAVHFQGRDR